MACLFVVEVNSAPLVSIDFNDNLFSSVIDLSSNSLTDGVLCMVFAWYNNELAYANRVLNLIKFLTKREK